MKETVILTELVIPIQNNIDVLSVTRRNVKQAVSLFVRRKQADSLFYIIFDLVWFELFQSIP